MGHLCLVPRLGAASTWEASCSVCGSEGASMVDEMCGGVCVCVGFWGDSGGMEISGRWREVWAF